MAALSSPSHAAPATPGTSAPDVDLPALKLALTDTGFEIDEPLTASRYQVTVSNKGTLSESHFALGKIPDDVTDAEYEAFLQAQDDTEASASRISALSVFPMAVPGGSVSGVIDLAPGSTSSLIRSPAGSPHADRRG